ncbi:MAG: response regulator transcription factor [Bacteroidota bacterium]
MKFLLVDDHKIIRDGLKQILSMHFPSSTFDEGSSAEDVIHKIALLQYDIIICDLTMPGRSGLDLVTQVRDSNPKLPILMLSMHSQDFYAVRALKAGAWAYINKSDGADVLIPAIQMALRGRKYIPSDIAEILAENLNMQNENGKDLEKNLSRREFDVFKLIAEGNSISDIAKQLSLSLSTISTHRSRILGKMNMKSNADLVKYAVKKGLI